MRLDERRESILDFIIRDYIDTAFPVSSGKIYKSYGTNRTYSPATIRNIMLELDEDGFLTQPHTSAGRIPTDRGWQYFVDFLIEVDTPPKSIQKSIDQILVDE